MAEKKIEVEIDGRVRKVPEHMVEDILKFGAVLTRRAVKTPPVELLTMPIPKKIVLLPKENLPEFITPPEVSFPAEPVESAEPKVKKTVRRKK